MPASDNRRFWFSKRERRGRKLLDGSFAARRFKADLQLALEIKVVPGPLKYNEETVVKCWNGSGDLLLPGRQFRAHQRYILGNQ